MSFAGVLGVLLVRNAFLFTSPEYERADMGANSILIEQARRFSLLVGNYSRKGFNHPGPAFLYVESWGESVFWAWLRVVPAAWNGQLIALYGLNALFAACVVAVCWGWSRSARGALAGAVAVGWLGAAHPPAFSSDWMPYVYVLPFLVFTVSLASVAAGQRRDGWIVALSGWFLIHGHAAFLFIVPVMAGVPLTLHALRRLAATRARRLTAAGSGQPGPPRGPTGERLKEEQRAARRHWRSWLAVIVISALFTLPMLLELALHGDGNFAQYFAYGSSSSAGGHSAAQVTGFVLWFWWTGANPWLAPLLLTVASVGVTSLLPAGRARTWCRSLLLTDALAAALVIAYTVAGVDQIGDHYIGYFSYALPAAALLVIVTAAAELLAARARTGLAVAAVAAVAAAACAAFAAAPDTRTSTYYVDQQKPHGGYATDPHLAAAVARMGALADGRTIVLSFPHNGWTDVTGILVQASRTGVRACVADPGWAFLMSSQSICSLAQARNGDPMTVYPDDQIPPGADPVARLQRAIVTSGTKRT